MSDVDPKYDPAEATTRIVASYVGHNNLPMPEVANLIRTVKRSLDSLSEPPAVAPQEPAVSLKRLVTPDAIYCAECGAKFKSLKRHLGAEHGLTPDKYREKWGLTKDSPMVAPNYSARRSEFAKSIGLGRNAKAPSPHPKPVKAAKASPAPEPIFSPTTAPKRTTSSHPKPPKVRPAR